MPGVGKAGSKSASAEPGGGLVQITLRYHAFASGILKRSRTSSPVACASGIGRWYWRLCVQQAAAILRWSDPAPRIAG
jgi:hypothetical protein